MAKELPELMKDQQRLEQQSERERLKATLLSVCGTLILVAGILLPLIGFSMPQQWTTGIGLTFAAGALCWQLLINRKFERLMRDVTDQFEILVFPAPHIAVNATVSPHSSSLELDRKVLRPLENTGDAVNGIQSLSVSTSAGHAEVRFFFAEDTDMEIALEEVLSHVECIIPKLPEDLEEVTIRYLPRAGDKSTQRVVRMAKDAESSLALDGARRLH